MKKDLPSYHLKMNNFMGEFTVFHGQPGYIEARIDADLLSISIGD